MKKIVNGRLYDTGEAVAVCSWRETAAVFGIEVEAKFTLCREKVADKPMEGLKLVYTVNDAAVTVTYNAVPDATKTWANLTNGGTLKSQTAGKYITVALVNEQTGKCVSGGNTTLVVGT